MAKKLTTEEFVEKAEKVHGKGTYDYSFVEYINSLTKVKIICPKHGLFMQSPNRHLSGNKCKICSGKKLTMKEFVERSQVKHKNKYEYIFEQLTGIKEKVKIICPKHGLFKQVADYHLSGHGCSKCSNNRKLTTEEFIEKSNKTHNNKYDYSLSKYISSHKSVTIKCPIHGLFNQQAQGHLKGQGCKKCSIDLLTKKRAGTTKTFIKCAKKTHGNKYDYSEVIYKNFLTKIKIKCPKHGPFEQTAKNHLKGHGCSRCNNRISKGQNALFESIKKKYKKVFLEYCVNLNSHKYFVDIYIPKTNTIIEYYGDYWHCNPKKHGPNYFHPHKKMTAQQIWTIDKLREKELKELGYKVIIVWESNFEKDKNSIISII